MSSVKDCNTWSTWSEAFNANEGTKPVIDFAVYITLVLLLASLSCSLALSMKSVISAPSGLSRARNPPERRDLGPRLTTTRYPATGSGVTELKLILGGHSLPGYLDTKTLFIKAIALILSSASGLSIGKEGPYVHLAAGISFVLKRFIDRKPSLNQQRMLRKGAASGLSVAFGAPISGVMYLIECFRYV